MEKLLKVLLSVDNNNYKITIKTKTFTNSVPFADFKHFVDDKHKLLFSDRNYVWKIFDSDFGEYVALDENTPIYDMSKIIAVATTNSSNDRNQRASFENNQKVIDYERRPPPPDLQQQTPQKALRQPPEIDLRDFVSAYRSPNVDPLLDSGGSFKTFYPSNQGTPNVARTSSLYSTMSSSYQNYSPQASNVMSGYGFQGGNNSLRGPNPFLNPSSQYQRNTSPPSYYTNLPPTFNDRHKSYDNYNRNPGFPTGNIRKKAAVKMTPNKTPVRNEPKKTPQPAKQVEKVPLKKVNLDNLESREKIVKAVLKYNEEFSMISQCEDDIWKTSKIWNFVAKEVAGQQDANTVSNVIKEFKEMLKKYECLLDKHMSHQDTKKLFPFFDFFHQKLDLRPFNEDIVRLKEAFNANNAVTSSDDKDVDMLPVASKDVEKNVERNQVQFDEKQDVFLLMAVSNFIDEFSKELILEDEVWSKVAKEVNESADDSKCKSRFYSLLEQYQQLSEKESGSISSAEKTLKFLFSKMDISPFQRIAKQMDADDDCLFIA